MYSKENVWSDKKQRFKIIDEVETGSFGVIYEAMDQKTKNVVAVKKFKFSRVKQLGLTPRDWKQKIKTEKNMLEICDHRNIVKFIAEYQVSAKELYTVMEFCDGGSLRDYMYEIGGPMNEQSVRNFAIQIKDALLYLRKNEITHRNLKPGHILLTEQSAEATVKLTDFGGSKVKKFDSSGMTAYKTAAAVSIYVAPEVQMD